MMSQASNKYHIRINPDKPSRSNVQEHKDFHRLLLQYKRTKRPRPLHSVLGRVNRLAPLIIIVLSLLVILIFYIQFAKQQEKQEAPAKPKSMIEQSYVGKGWGGNIGGYIPTEHRKS